MILALMQVPLWSRYCWWGEGLQIYTSRRCVCRCGKEPWKWLLLSSRPALLSQWTVQYQSLSVWYVQLFYYVIKIHCKFNCFVRHILLFWCMKLRTLGTLAIILSITAALDNGWLWVWSTQWNGNCQRKPKFLEEVFPCATLTIKNLTCLVHA